MEKAGWGKIGVGKEGKPDRRQAEVGELRRDDEGVKKEGKPKEDSRNTLEE